MGPVINNLKKCLTLHKSTSSCCGSTPATLISMPLPILHKLAPLSPSSLADEGPASFHSHVSLKYDSEEQPPKYGTDIECLWRQYEEFKGTGDGSFTCRRTVKT